MQSNLDTVNTTVAFVTSSDPQTFSHPLVTSIDKPAFAKENEIPQWLYWIIAALVIFLAILALLLYKYWWKNKATGAALGTTQKELDAAVMEEEVGFAADVGTNAVGFNPLATGFNPNAPAGGVGPNAPPNGQGGGANFIKPNVEKTVYRQDYGAQMGNLR